MKLKNKILLGFSSVLGIVLILSIVLGISLRDINRISRGVASVDNAIIDMLVTQGRILRFALYKDASFVPQARESLGRSVKSFEAARELLTKPENREGVVRQLDTLKGVDRQLTEMTILEQRRLQIEEGLLPLTAQLDTQLLALRTHLSSTVDMSEKSPAFDRYNLVVDAYNLLMKARIAARVYTMSSSPENERAAIGALTNTQTAIRGLSGMVLEPAGTAIVTAVDTAFRGYSESFQNLVTVSGQILQTNVTVRDMFVSVLNDGMKVAGNASGTLLNVGEQSTTALYVGGLIVFLMLLGVALLLTRNVQAQLGMDPGELGILAERVTKGDYDIDNGSPRIGVYGNLLAMVAALKENIHNAQTESEKAQQESVRAQKAMQTAEDASLEAQKKTTAMLEAADRLDEVAQIVSSASAQLSAQIENSEQGAADQADRVTETATAMEEMNASVLEVARNAGQAAEVSTATREKAMTGASVVARAVKSIQFVQQQSLSLKVDMEQLGTNARSIDQIMGVISDIADQTNLLALNAAIEAARAGDAGRGFAVVADEVRKLAEKTMASTTDVGNAIRAIQQSANKSMEQVDVAVSTIEDATKLANESGVVLQEIVTLVDSTADQVRAIATASEQQSTSSDEINQSMYKVRNIAGETARSMVEATQAVSELARQAQILARLIDDMKRS